ncbi:MAG: hypothetical protein DRI84_02545 [Bacteroidetes bacterium]|nr:MAG: hypothetical protein DRI84_02545 [Bacteroidota bacterium]
MPNYIFTFIFISKRMLYLTDRSVNIRRISMPLEKTKNIEALGIDKKQRILEAALKVFAQKSYHGASMSNIAQLAGVSKGLIYNYFTNKEALVKELLLENFKHFFDSYDFDFDNIGDKEMVSFIEQSFFLLDEHPESWKLLFGLSMQTEILEIITPELMTFFEPLLIGFTKYFASKGYKDSEAETKFFWALMDGISLDYLTMGLDREYCINRMKQIYQLD